MKDQLNKSKRHLISVTQKSIEDISEEIDLPDYLFNWHLSYSKQRLNDAYEEAMKKAKSDCNELDPEETYLCLKNLEP